MTAVSRQMKRKSTKLVYLVQSFKIININKIQTNWKPPPFSNRLNTPESTKMTFWFHQSRVLDLSIVVYVLEYL